MDGDVIDVEQMLAFEAAQRRGGGSASHSLLQRNAGAGAKGRGARRAGGDLVLDHYSERDLARGGASFRRDAMRSRRTAMLLGGAGEALAAANDATLAAHLLAR